MFWTLIAAFVAGVAGALVGLALRHLSRNRLPRGIMPICAGLAMIGTTINLEYTWFASNLDELPADAVVLSTRETQAIYKPWTFLRPQVHGFIAYAPSEAAETVPDTGVYVIQAHIRERWQPAIIRPVVVDCGAGERFDIDGTTQFGPDGRPLEEQAVGSGPDDPIVTAVCAS